MKKYILLILISFFVGTTIQAQSFQLIVNNANSASSISKSNASAFFLKKKTKWADGTKVAAIDLSSKSSVRANFSKAVHNKSTSQIRAFWQQSVFSGKATPLKELGSDAAVITFVKGNRGAIGYISSSTNTNGVKVLNIK